MNWSLLKVLVRSPWAPALLRNYRIQRPGDCVTNSEVMQENILLSLHSQDQVDIAGSSRPCRGALQRLRQLLGVNEAAPPLDREYRHDPTVADIVDMVELHGPCVLSLARLLPADQGGTQYAGHHAVLVVGTFQAEGRHWAVALDGNDLQSNPVMERVRAYTEKYLGGDLEKITESDLSAIQREIEQHGEPVNSGQLVYTLIHLDEVVPKADKAYGEYLIDVSRGNGYSDLPPITFPNALCVPTNATVKGEPMPDAMKRELAGLVARSAPDSSWQLKVRAPEEEL